MGEKITLYVAQCSLCKIGIAVSQDEYFTQTVAALPPQHRMCDKCDELHGFTGGLPKGDYAFEYKQVWPDLDAARFVVRRADADKVARAERIDRLRWEALDKAMRQIGLVLAIPPAYLSNRAPWMDGAQQADGARQCTCSPRELVQGASLGIWSDTCRYPHR